MLVLPLIACSLAVACEHSPTTLRTRPAPQPRFSTYVVGSGDTLVLSYVCGNTFRLRQSGTRTTDTTFTWVSTLPETGSVVIPRTLPGRTGREGFFTASTADTVGIQGLPSALREANGGTANCNPPRDTNWTTATTFESILALTVDSTKEAGPTGRPNLSERPTKSCQRRQEH